MLTCQVFSLKNKIKYYIVYILNVSTAVNKSLVLFVINSNRTLLSFYLLLA